MRYVIGLILIAIGIGMIWRTDVVMSIFGRSDWAEEKFGTGGTWSFYKLIGVCLIILAFLLMFGRIFDLIDFIFVR